MCVCVCVCVLLMGAAFCELHYGVIKFVHLVGTTNDNVLDNVIN